MATLATFKKNPKINEEKMDTKVLNLSVNVQNTYNQRLIKIEKTIKLNLTKGKNTSLRKKI